MRKYQTRKSIAQKVYSSEFEMANSLIKLYNHQTVDEKETDQTIYKNTVGFNVPDAAPMTKAAEFFIANGRLDDGLKFEVSSRLPKYFRQLARIENKEARIAATAHLPAVARA